MKRTIKHVPPTQEQKQAIGEFLASTGIFNPLSIALDTGEVQPVPPRGHPGRPRNPKLAERDAQIVQMKDEQEYSFGKIARKLNIGREVCESAYYRMKAIRP
jgi:hypothetical protein